jgi:hypothetical protein
VTGKVTVSPLPKGQQQVEIAWTVTWPNGKVVGKVSQLNSVPAGSLDSYWGDVAAAAAQEASGGIYAVVERFIDSNKNPPSEATAPSQASPPGPPARVSGPGAAGIGATPPVGSAPASAQGGATAGRRPAAQSGASARPTENR